MKKITITLTGLLLVTTSQLFGQIFLFDFGAGTVPTSCSDAVTVDNAVGTPTFQLSSGLNNQNYFNGAPSGCATFGTANECARSAQNWTAAGGQYYQVTASTTNWSTMTFSACLRSSAGTNAGTFQLRLSTDGTMWTNVGSTISFSGAGASIAGVSEAIPSTFDDQPIVYFQLLNSGTGLSTTAVRIDKVQLTGTSLPIELATFEAKSQGNTVSLDWKTMSEKNNEYFSIERSTNGTDFVAIGRQNGAGNSLEPQSYRFTDYQPTNGTNYYRLQQFDSDGNSSYSHIAVVQVKTANIKVSPTTARSGQTISLDLSEVNGAATVQIININGATIGQYQYEANTIAEVSLPSLPTGVYFLQIHAFNINTVQKLIITE
jgi:Secretion system C-terminal sorting domain